MREEFKSEPSCIAYQRVCDDLERTTAKQIGAERQVQQQGDLLTACVAAGEDTAAIEKRTVTLRTERDVRRDRRAALIEATKEAQGVAKTALMEFTRQHRLRRMDEAKKAYQAVVEQMIDEVALLCARWDTAFRGSEADQRDTADSRPGFADDVLGPLPDFCPVHQLVAAAAEAEPETA